MHMAARCINIFSSSPNQTFKSGTQSHNVGALTLTPELKQT